MVSSEEIKKGMGRVTQAEISEVFITGNSKTKKKIFKIIFLFHLRTKSKDLRAVS